MDTPHAHIAKGTFLIATPDIDAGIFFRAVVLVCEHNANGSFGIIINKKVDLELPEELLDLEHFPDHTLSILAGGPVQTNQLMLIHTSNNLGQNAIKICDGVYLGGDLTFLQQSLASQNSPELRLCFGYAGWGAGQLEREFLDGGWFICPAEKDVLFRTPPEKLWQTLLRKMGGKYATLSMIPEDLSLN
ncbi:MAG: YqgE/AlgH family protein [Parachlamydiales bacterium]|nr:YqgE/AlgH family protein [Parachlamydiales bacterium]